MISIDKQNLLYFQYSFCIFNISSSVSLLFFICFSRCLKKPPLKSSTSPFSDNPAFEPTPVPSLYNPSIHSTVSLVGAGSLGEGSLGASSTGTGVNADHGLGIILKAGARPKMLPTTAGSESGSAAAVPVDSLPLATLPTAEHNPSRRRSISPIRDFVDPDIDPRSPVIEDAPPMLNPPHWTSPYRQKAERRPDVPELHPYFDPRSPVTDVPQPKWPTSIAPAYTQKARPREDQPQLNPYFDPRSPVSAVNKPEWPAAASKPSPFAQRASPRPDKLDLNPYHDPRSPLAAEPSKMKTSLAQSPVSASSAPGVRAKSKSPHEQQSPVPKAVLSTGPGFFEDVMVVVL